MKNINVRLSPADFWNYQDSEGVNKEASFAAYCNLVEDEIEADYGYDAIISVKVANPHEVSDSFDITDATPDEEEDIIEDIRTMAQYVFAILGEQWLIFEGVK